MKRILLTIPVVVLLLMLTSSPVLAADPPGVDVDVVVVTPGDVDLDVGINAGGDVNVTVDGVDLKQTAATADAALSGANSANDRLANPNVMWDYSYYWVRTGIGPRIEGQIVELQEVLSVLLVAEAKLIEGHELTGEQIAEMRTTLSSLRERDREIWDQLMYGAEAHLALLDTEVSNYITYNNQQVEELEYQLADANQDRDYLEGYITNLNRLNAGKIELLQNSFWIFASCTSVLLIVCFAMLVRRGRRI